MTKREIIYQVLEKLNIHSDDSKITEELVSSMIDIKRAFLLKQQYSKRPWNIPSEVKQEVFMEVNSVDRVKGYGDAGKILSTYYELPDSIKIKGKEGPFLIRKMDGSEIPFNVVPVERVPYLFENKYTQHLIYCVVDHDKRLKLISRDNKLRFLKEIKIVDIFEQPEEAMDYDKMHTKNVDYWDQFYPVEVAMIGDIVNLVSNDLIKSLGIPSDKINDSSDERRQ